MFKFDADDILDRQEKKELSKRKSLVSSKMRRKALISSDYSDYIDDIISTVDELTPIFQKLKKIVDDAIANETDDLRDDSFRNMSYELLELADSMPHDEFDEDIKRRTVMMLSQYASAASYIAKTRYVNRKIKEYNNKNTENI